MAMDDELTDYLAIIMKLPFMYWFTNDRWVQCLDVMLEKSKGVRQIHHLHIIGLVEEDFNMALKYNFANYLVANAERSQPTEEQFCG